MPVITVPTLRNLPFEEHRNQILLKVEEFIQFIKENKSSGDKTVRTDNLKAELSKKKELQIFDDSVYITFQGVLVYIFNHINDYNIFKIIAEDVTAHFIKGKNNLSNKDNSPKSILELYRQVAKLNVPKPNQELFIDEARIDTLHLNYKSDFSACEWEVICRFEYQFQRKNRNILDYDKTILKKSEFLEKLKTTCELGEHFKTDCSQLMSENEQRRKASECINGETLTLNNIVHTYDGLFKSVEDYIENVFKYKADVVCTDCLSPHCVNHSKGIHVWIEASGTEAEFGTFEEQATVIRSQLHRVHGVTVPEIIFLEHHTFKNYRCKQCQPNDTHIFHFRDEYFCGKLSNKIIYNSRAYQEDYIDLEDPELLDYVDVNYCQYCFQSVASFIHKPLDWKHFDLINEWYLEVPLEFQTVFDNWFINKDTLRKSDCSESYVLNRISKLYSLLDSTLNIHNRKYFGILQELNTQELIVNYHSISTIFDITSQNGLKSATKWLQSRSDEDKRYYDAYLKHYPLEFENQNGLLQTDTCMRDCHFIFYLDNLVRWSHHGDPDPGKKRTSQICTLPITLKGIQSSRKLFNLGITRTANPILTVPA